MEKPKNLKEALKLTDLRFRLVEPMLREDKRLRKRVRAYLYFYA